MELRTSATSTRHLVLDNRPLRDLYFTLMNEVYGLGVTDFGQNLTGASRWRSTVSVATRSRPRSTFGGSFALRERG
jgi:hypothetical protein